MCFDNSRYIELSRCWTRSRIGGRGVARGKGHKLAAGDCRNTGSRLSGSVQDEVDLDARGSRVPEAARAEPSGREDDAQTKNMPGAFAPGTTEAEREKNVARTSYPDRENSNYRGG